VTVAFVTNLKVQTISWYWPNSEELWLPYYCNALGVGRLYLQARL